MDKFEFFWWHRLILTKVYPINPNLVSVFLQHPLFFCNSFFIFSVQIKPWTFWVYCRAKLVGVREIRSSDSHSWVKKQQKNTFTFKHFLGCWTVILANGLRHWMGNWNTFQIQKYISGGDVLLSVFMKRQAHPNDYTSWRGAACGPLYS